MVDGDLGRSQPLMEFDPLLGHHPRRSAAQGGRETLVKHTSVFRKDLNGEVVPGLLITSS